LIKKLGKVYSLGDDGGEVGGTVVVLSFVGDTFELEETLVVGVTFWLSPLGGNGLGGVIDPGVAGISVLPSRPETLSGAELDGIGFVVVGVDISSDIILFR